MDVIALTAAQDLGWAYAGEPGMEDLAKVMDEVMEWAGDGIENEASRTNETTLPAWSWLLKFAEKCFKFYFELLICALKTEIL